MIIVAAVKIEHERKKETGSYLVMLPPSGGNGKRHVQTVERCRWRR